MLCFIQSTSNGLEKPGEIFFQDTDFASHFFLQDESLKNLGLDSTKVGWN